MSLPKPSKPEEISGGPTVVSYEPEPRPPKRTPVHAKVTPTKKNERELLSSKDFVEKYRNEVKTAAWDPKVLAKCGKGAEEILKTLGAKIKNPNIPFKEQMRLREQRKYKEALQGTQQTQKANHKKDQKKLKGGYKNHNKNYKKK